MTADQVIRREREHARVRHAAAAPRPIRRLRRFCGDIDTLPEADAGPAVLGWTEPLTAQLCQIARART